jgi:hypothetical protein
MTYLTPIRMAVVCMFGLTLPLPVFNRTGLVLLALFIVYGEICRAQGEREAPTGK